MRGSASGKGAIDGEEGGDAGEGHGRRRHAEVEVAQGKTVAEICRALGISEASCFRWRSEYGGLKLGQARRHDDDADLSDLH
jgi:transposase-like protein